MKLELVTADLTLIQKSDLEGNWSAGECLSDHDLAKVVGLARSGKQRLPLSLPSVARAPVHGGWGMHTPPHIFHPPPEIV